MWELVLAREKEVGGSEALIEGGRKFHIRMRRRKGIPKLRSLCLDFSLWFHRWSSLCASGSDLVLATASCGIISYILVAGELDAPVHSWDSELLAAHTGRVELKQVFLSYKPPRT